MKFIIAALFALSFTLGACDDTEADVEFREACPNGGTVEGWVFLLFGDDYTPVAPVVDTKALLCEMQHECTKQEIRPVCWLEGTSILCECGGVICRGEPETMTYACAL